MAKLPDRESLGAAPSARSGRAIARFDTTAVGEGMQDFGRGLQQASNAFAQIAEAQNQVNEFETERRFQEFKWNQKLALDEAMREVEPGKAEDFPEQWTSTYQERASEFFQTVPEDLKPKYDLKLFGAEKDTYRDAATFARKEQKRFSINSLEDFRQNYLLTPKAAEDFDKAKEDYTELVEKNPYLTPIEKDEQLRKGLSEFEKWHVETRLQRGDPWEEVMRDLRGNRPDVDTPGDREAGTGRIADLPEREERKPAAQTTRFAPEINTAINEAAKANDVDPRLLATFAQIESSGNPNAKRGSYKGLFQLSEDIFAEYGGEGDIFDPQENANAAARKLKQDIEEFEDKFDRKPEPVDLYLLHQQGEGGYAAHVSNPEAPAWENMHSTAEGQEKGERWAKQAIWGNIPNDMKRRFGSVEDVSSQEFIDIWRKKINRLGGGSTATAAREETEGFEGPYDHLSLDDRQTLIRKVKIAQREKTKQDVRDSVEMIRRTGQAPVDEAGQNALDRAQNILTKNQYEKQRLDWIEAEHEYEALHDLERMPEADLQEHLDDLEPSPGADLYEIKAKVYDEAVKRAKDLRDQRDNDPAESVSGFSEVQEAEEYVRANPDDPQAIQHLARVRLDAQEAVGIPPGLRTPITKDEARVLMAPVRGLEGQAMYEALEDIQEKIQRRYGDYARNAAITAIDYVVRSKELSEKMSRFMTKTMRGLPVSAAEQRDIEELAAMKQADEALAFVGEPLEQYGMAPSQTSATQPMSPDPFQSYGMSPLQMAGLKQVPPKRAIEFLKTNPDTADQFDRKYGQGMAKKYLDGG